MENYSYFRRKQHYLLGSPTSEISPFFGLSSNRLTWRCSNNHPTGQKDSTLVGLLSTYFPKIALAFRKTRKTRINESTGEKQNKTHSPLLGYLMNEIKHSRSNVE